MTERKRKKQQAGADDYLVGYKKPPAEHRFKKGQPRPPRRSKPDKPDPTIDDYIADVLKEPMRIVEKGIETYVPKGLALAKAAVNGAIKHEDPRRLRDFLPKSKAQEGFDFSDIDLTIVARFMAHLQNQQELPQADDDDDDDDDGGEEAAA